MWLLVVLVMATVILALAGPGIGHWLGGLLGLGAFGTPGRMFVAILGAMALLAVLKAAKTYD